MQIIEGYITESHVIANVSTISAEIFILSKCYAL